MSKHWKPDESVVQPLPKRKRLKSLDEFVAPDFLGRPSTPLRTGMDRVRQAGRSLPDGAKAGLVIVAAACLGVAVGFYLAFGPHEPIAPEARAEWNGAAGR